MRCRILCLLLALIPAAQAAEPTPPAEESPLGLSYVETKDLKLFYFDPTPSYLMPHAVRTFTNSLEWQRRVLGWVPYERTTVTPVFYLNWLRTSVFASALWTDPERSTLRRRFGNVGVQADLRFSVLHGFDMVLSVGYAVGYRGTARAGDEWMVSLKIM